MINFKVTFKVNSRITVTFDASISCYFAACSSHKYQTLFSQLRNDVNAQ